MNGGSRGWSFTLILLGMLSLSSFGGPFLILVVVMGGESRRWPPDRPIEWIVMTGVVAIEVVLIVACLTVSWWRRPFWAPSPAHHSEPESPGGSAASS